MLLKKVWNREKLYEIVHKGNKTVSCDLDTLIFSMEVRDRYFLDLENALVIIDNPDSSSKNRYVMIHYRLINGNLVEINRWDHSTYYFELHNDDVIKDLNLFMVQGGRGLGCNSHNCYGAIYNYKLGSFVVEKDLFDCIGTTNLVSGINYAVPGPNYLKKYNCFLAYFYLSSVYEDGDIITYENPVTCEQMEYNFNITDGLYFALLTPDGKIKGNKLFKGENFSRIVEYIDLDKNVSLKEFKQERIRILNERKRKEKEQYYKELVASGKEYISPYLDQEVMDVLKLEKKLIK